MDVFELGVEYYGGRSIYSDIKLTDEEIEFINESSLLIIKTLSENHLAYYNDDHKSYFIIHNQMYSKQLSYSSYYDRKKDICLWCRRKLIINYKRRNNDFNYIFGDVEYQTQVSLRCSAITKKIRDASIIQIHTVLFV